MNFEHPGNDQISQLLQLWKDVFGEYDGFWDLFLDTAFSPDHCRCITEEGQVMAGLYWFDCSCEGDKIAYIYAVVTDPQHRGRGLCRMLMTEVHSLLKEQGYAIVILVPAQEDLREMYRKMGYENCSGITSLTCTAGETAAEVRTIDIPEYAALRRKLLPEKAVLQEGVQLSFLAAQAQLFAGEDFLLAAYLEEETLHGVELLGNVEAAPGILRALGCEKGIFQIPGNDKSFAMIHKLQEASIIPNYFGFAFD